MEFPLTNPMEKNMGNELQTMNDEFSNFVAAFDAGDEETLMKLAGQGEETGPKMGLPRMTSAH